MLMIMLILVIMLMMMVSSLSPHLRIDLSTYLCLHIYTSLSPYLALSRPLRSSYTSPLFVTPCCAASSYDCLYRVVDATLHHSIHPLQILLRCVQMHLHITKTLCSFSHVLHIQCVLTVMVTMIKLVMLIMIKVFISLSEAIPTLILPLRFGPVHALHWHRPWQSLHNGREAPGCRL